MQPGTPRRLLLALLVGLTFPFLANAALDAHVFSDSDGDGALNDCAGQDADGDGIAGPTDELDHASCSGAATSGGRKLCVAGDAFDVDGDGGAETLHGAIHTASQQMIGPGDRVSVHGGVFGDVDGDGQVEQQATFRSMLHWFDVGTQIAECVVPVLDCPSCTQEGHRRHLAAASHGAVTDEPVIDLGNALPTAFGIENARYATIQGFHVIHQDMDETYGVTDGVDGVRRAAFEAWCPDSNDQPTRLEIRNNRIDTQVETMGFEPHRSHLHIAECSHLTIDSNTFEAAVYHNIKSIYGNNHHTITNNRFRADNDVSLVHNNVAYGIYLNGNDGNIIRGNYLHRTGTTSQGASAGLRIRNHIGPDPTIIEDNVIRGWMHCVYFQESSNSAPGFVHFRNNDCISDGVGTSGVSAIQWQDASVYVRNNIVSGYNSLFQGTPAAATVGHNLFHAYNRLYHSSNSGSSVTWEGGDVCHSDEACGATSGAFAACALDASADSCDPDPGFAAAGARPHPYYTLSPGSPAIDAGDNGSCSRTPVGSACDIGAYEYHASTGGPDPVGNLHRTDVRTSP